MPDTSKAPGLVYRTRRNSPPVAYWAARRDLVKAGYRPKTVRLHGEPDVIEARCHALQAEMLEWSAEKRLGRAPQYDGTFASLVKFYEMHPDSPYRELKPATQRSYSKTMALLMRHKGERRVDKVDGSDVRRWYKELCASHSKGWAALTVNILKAILSFGATKRITECRVLRAELREAKFGTGSKRKERLTYRQVAAFRDTAREMGFGWMGLLLTIQFECGLRRRDVIGEWIDDELGTDGIRNGKRVWRDGLTWKHIDAEGVLRKLVSKTALTSEEEAVHVIAEYPELAAELAKLTSQIGPIVINHKTGLPPTEAQCRAYFRRIARKAGIPDNVWNMDARAGAVTEAYESGATEEEAMALATHTEAKTSHGYDREMMERSRRAAQKRVGSRKE